MEILKGKRGCNIYAHNDYCYNIDKRDNITYRCNTRASTKCPGAVKFKHGKICLLKEHNHPPSKYVIEISKLKEEMLALCRDTVLTAKEIFDSVCRKYPTEAAYITFPSIKSTLNAERLKNKPKNPTTLAALPALMMNYAPVMPIYKGTAQIGSEIAVIFSTDTLMDLLASSTEIFVDGTFAVLPSTPSIAQVYSIHTRYMDTGIATMFILCSSRTSLMYSCMWDKILELIPQLRTNLKYAMIDFEKAAINALQLKFPDIKLHGCWFHYNQAVYRKWRRLNLTYAPNDILLMSMTLPLAPVELFPKGLKLMQVEADKLCTKYPAILQFLRYMRVYWLPMAEKISVSECAIRTNNIVESFHRNARQKMGTNNLNIWIFLEKLKNLMTDQELDLARLKNGLFPRRPRTVANRNQNRKIFRSKEDLLNKRVSLEHFLKMFYVKDKLFEIEKTIFNDEVESELSEEITDPSLFINNGTEKVISNNNIKSKKGLQSMTEATKTGNSLLGDFDSSLYHDCSKYNVIHSHSDTISSLNFISELNDEIAETSLLLNCCTVETAASDNNTKSIKDQLQSNCEVIKECNPSIISDIHNNFSNQISSEGVFSGEMLINTVLLDENDNLFSEDLTNDNSRSEMILLNSGDTNFSTVEIVVLNSTNNSVKKRFCIVCNKKATHACVPCGHVALCGKCSEQVANDKCPTCNITVLMFMLLL